jgi:hypothetical protein
MTVTKDKSKQDKRTIPPALMLRIKACGIVYQADKPDKIAEIAKGKDITIDEAGIAYVIGSISNMLRTGVANNYRTALDILEARQVGDRGDMLNPPNALSWETEKINRMNKGNTYIPEYMRSTDNGKTWTAIFPVNKPAGYSHTRNMGKIYGSMYTEQCIQEEEADPARILSKTEFESVQAHRDKHLKLFFTEYMSRLSRTCQRHIQAIKDSPDNSGYLASRAGREDPRTKGIARAAENLFSNFPHKEGLTRRDYIDLVRQYT